MRDTDKIDRLAKYNKIDLIDFDTKVESAYSKEVLKLDNGSCKNYELTNNDILGVIDKMSTADPHRKFEDFNIVYDEVTNKLTIYRSSVWDNYLLEVGILEMLNIIKSLYLDSYESYLIKKYIQIIMPTMLINVSYS